MASTRTAIAYAPCSDEAATSSEDIAAAAGELRIVGVTHDQGHPRDGLVEALELLSAGQATTLVTARLGTLAGSLRELVALLDWLAAGELQLVAHDVVSIRAHARAGAPSACCARSSAGSDEPGPGRAPRGRPGLVAQAPDLGERVAAMRERGLSLQAIADRLNADGIATPRGGALWRPSSVQAATRLSPAAPPGAGCAASPTRPTRATAAGRESGARAWTSSPRPPGAQPGSPPSQARDPLFPGPPRRERQRP